MFWKGDDIDVSPMRASPGSTSDHLIVSTEVRGTGLASLVAPCAPPSMIFWDDLPDLPYDLLSDLDKEQHAWGLSRAVPACPCGVFSVR